MSELAIGNIMQPPGKGQLWQGQVFIFLKC
jgi:hypothetical protein